MKFDWLKSKHRLFDFVIAVLIIATIILADVLIIKMKSGLAEEKNLINQETLNQSQSSDSGQDEKFINNQEFVFIPILNFHHIDSAPANLGKVARSYYLEPDKFEAILNDLLANDYRLVFLSEIVKYLQDKKLPQEKIMAITFDDGNIDFYTQAWPILQKLKIKSNMYIMTGVRGKNWVSPEQIVELDKSGLVEIGSHTVWHPYITRISKERQMQELQDSKSFLDKLINENINVICYPFGLHNQQIEDLAKQAGYQAGLTFDQDAWQKLDDLMELKRISVYPGLEVIKFLSKLEKEK